MTVLVTGGAGFIGSITVERLRARGDAVVVLDDLSHGHRAAIRDVPFYEGAVESTLLPSPEADPGGGRGAMRIGF